MIPEVSFSKSGRMYVNDGKRFEKRLFANLQKSKALPFELRKKNINCQQYIESSYVNMMV